MRSETDALGAILVPADSYWGAQTERSRQHFSSGGVRFQFSRPLIRAMGLVKKAAAIANAELSELDDELAKLISAAADEVISGQLDAHFPLVVFQTGSGTQTNMNANEVIANRGNEIAGSARGSKAPLHPNDHVNRGQSSNDVFPTAMYVAVCEELNHTLLPALRQLIATLHAKAEEFALIVKVGRTHLQDAVPLTLGQEIGAWVAQLNAAVANIIHHGHGVTELAIGATAVGTGLNAHPQFGARVATQLSRLTGLEFRCAANPFTALAAHDGLVNVSASLRTVAGALFKMANDIRLLASGPRCGIGEILIPENEPGSSIMPGKVNPTQAEALTMVCVQVMGNDAAVAFAGSQGHLQLNTFKPVMLHNVLESIQLLSEACHAFNLHCACGIRPNQAVIEEHLARNIMLVTALSPHIGYDKAAQIAHLAQHENLTLREAALASGFLTGEQFATWVQPLALAQPHLAR